MVRVRRVTSRKGRQRKRAGAKRQSASQERTSAIHSFHIGAASETAEAAPQVRGCRSLGSAELQNRPEPVEGSADKTSTFFRAGFCRRQDLGMNEVNGLNAESYHEGINEVGFQLTGFALNASE